MSIRLASVFALCYVAACSASTPHVLGSDTESAHSIYVVGRDWHTGIAIATDAWPNRGWTLLADFPGARFLEFGWGDAVYYQAGEDEKTVGTTLAAVLWPTPSVMEVFGSDGVSMEASAGYDVVELHVSAQQLHELGLSIAASFAGDAIAPTGTVRVTEKGESRFYHARGKFHFFRMCNRWTAERLKAAGCSIRPWSVFTASRVLREARRCEASRMSDAALLDRLPGAKRY